MRLSLFFFLSLTAAAWTRRSLRPLVDPQSAATSGTLNDDSMFMASPQGAPLLSDVIGQKQCTIMSDYTMGLEIIARRLADGAQKTLVLAPINSAILALPRKPWVDGPHDPRDSSISPLKNEDRAAKNIEAFVARHIVAQYPLVDGSTVANIAGQSITYEVRNGEKYINGNNKVVFEKEAANGAIWILSNVIAADQVVPQHEGL